MCVCVSPCNHSGQMHLQNTSKLYCMHAACCMSHMLFTIHMLCCRYGIVLSQMVFISIDIFATIFLGYAMTLSRPAK